VLATTAFGTTLGDDMIFTTTNYADLTGLTLSHGASRLHSADRTTSYLATVPFAHLTTSTIIPLAAYPTSTVTVNGTTVVSGAASGPIALTLGRQPDHHPGLPTADGINAQTYTVKLTRLPESARFQLCHRRAVHRGRSRRSPAIPWRLPLISPRPPEPVLTALNLTGMSAAARHLRQSGPGASRGVDVTGM